MWWFGCVYLLFFSMMALCNILILILVIPFSYLLFYLRTALQKVKENMKKWWSSVGATVKSFSVTRKKSENTLVNWLKLEWMLAKRQTKILNQRTHIRKDINLYLLYLAYESKLSKDKCKLTKNQRYIYLYKI